MVGRKSRRGSNPARSSLQGGNRYPRRDFRPTGPGVATYTTLSSEPEPKSSDDPKSSPWPGSLSAVRLGSKSIFWF